MAIYNLGKALRIGFEFFLILFDTLLSLIFAIQFTNLFIVVVEVTYRLIGLFIPHFCIAFSNNLIHFGKLFFVGNDIILCHGHDALVVLLNHVHIGIELGTIDALYLETVYITLFEELTRHRFLYCDSRITVLIAILIISTFYNLHNRQILEFRQLSLTQTLGSIGKNKSSRLTLIIHPYIGHELIVGIVPIIIAHMFLHERWLCGLVKRLGEHCRVWQVTGNLIVDILTQFVCTEIEISCIFKRTINLLVTRKRVFV